MRMRADQSANWEAGLTTFLANADVRDEEKRKARICGEKLAAIAATLPATPSELDLEDALKSYLRKAGYKQNYINNLMSVLHRIMASSPKLPLHHEKAAAWRDLISRHNENPSVIRPAAIEYILSWVTVTGLPVSPLTQDQLMEFTAFLESRGRNPFESGTRYRREFRKILVRAGLYVETAVKHDYSLPSEYESLFKEMEAHAVAPRRKTTKYLDLLDDNFGEDKDPIRPITWDKNRRYFTRYLKYQIANGFDGSDWRLIAQWKPVMKFITAVHGEKAMRSDTAQSIASSIIACLRVLMEMGRLRLTLDEFEQNLATPLWKRIDKFHEHFPSGGTGRDLPAYEKIYRKFLEAALEDLKKIRTKKSPRLLRTLVLAVFAFEFGCRPEDLRNTIRLEHIALRETLDGRKFYFLKYQPSKTNKSTTSMYATTALPPWFNEAFDLFFDEVRKSRADQPLFPTPHMSTRISQLSFRYLGQKFSANSYRKMIASFFSRNSIPGLYRMTGRVADKRLELITEIEMRHYAEGATNEEMLLEVRFGKAVQKILGIEDLVDNFLEFPIPERRKPVQKKED